MTSPDPFTLSGQMAMALRDVKDPQLPGNRRIAYANARIDFRFISQTECDEADAEALSFELSRRMNGE